MPKALERGGATPPFFYLDTKCHNSPSKARGVVAQKPYTYAICGIFDCFKKRSKSGLGWDWKNVLKVL